MDDLRGDQNIWIGCHVPMMPYTDDYGQVKFVEDHDKIWYDPCDESIGDVSIEDFLYRSYLEIGGNLNKKDFEEAFINIAERNGFKIEFATSFDKLPEPSAKELGKIYLVPSEKPELNDIFDQYIVVNGPDPDSENYMWERWGTGSTSVSLSNYYDKNEIDDKITEIQDTLDAISNNDLVKVIDTTVDKGISLAKGNAKDSIKVTVDITKLAQSLIGPDASKINGSTIVLGKDVSELITADKTIAESIKILADQIKASVTGTITSIDSSDNSITIIGDGTEKDLKVNIGNVIADGSMLRADDDGKLDVFWTEI